ncbi:MAG: glucose-6-phosphate isomerase [Oscillospiraceae bacterium]|nr:glucose-6-phosphate isomerase [Oscillospiraceae bacterium]
MDRISVDLSGTAGFVGGHELTYMEGAAEGAAHSMIRGMGPGSEFLGWLSLPHDYDKDEFKRILAAAEKVRGESDVFLVIGIGGSYLGARAAIDMLTHTFRNQLYKARKAPQVLFAGHNMSAAYMSDLLEMLEGREVSVNVISKSGTTTEPAVAFRMVKRLMEEKYGKEGAARRIYATTDKASGALRRMADAEGYETFAIPGDVGGRFSVLTAVGLLPMAVAGIDIGSVMAGAADYEKVASGGFPGNDCLKYASMRNILYRKGKSVEVMVSYEPSMAMFTEWWKQLFGESEGKDQKGIFPAGVGFTTDLHSMGQFIQDGARIMFETVINVDRSAKSAMIPDDPEDCDGLNFLSGMDMGLVNRKAAQGTLLAHVEGGVPNVAVNVPEVSAYWFGQLVYFFEMACGVSCRLMGVNPFDQPGVEGYKRNMFALLGKPGYERERAELEARL